MKLTDSILKTVFASALLFLFSCSQNDKESTQYKVEGVRLDITQVELIPGDTVTLNATLLPFNTTVDETVSWDSDLKDLVFWKSDNPKVAQVDDKGLVTAKEAGTCTVSFICGTMAAECKVIVRSFNQDVLYGMWEMQSLAEDDSLFFSYENTGYLNHKFFDWTFDGMRLSICYKSSAPGQVDRVLIITSIKSGIMNFYYADDKDKKSISLKKVPMSYTPEQIAFGQIEKPGLDTLIQVVDMGLPSGLKWASCNLGAASPEKEGVRYAWAEISPRESFSLDDYKWYDTSVNELTKYTGNNLSEFEADDDPATVCLGGQWRTPTAADVTELVENCYALYSSLEGIEGFVFIPKNENYNDKMLFVPFSRSMDDSSLTEIKSGYYWTSSLSKANSFDAYAFCISYEYNKLQLYGGLSLLRRFNGMFIRPVFEEKN